MPQEYLSLRDAAIQYHISYDTLRKAVQRSQLKVRHFSYPHIPHSIWLGLTARAKTLVRYRGSIIGIERSIVEEYSKKKCLKLP